MSPFDSVYAELRQIMLTSGNNQVIATDGPGSLVLRTSSHDPRTGEPGWFGTVAIKKSYVAYHLMSLYTDPSLAEGISERLAKRRQGKTCFNFKAVDTDLFSELAALTSKANAPASG